MHTCMHVQYMQLTILSKSPISVEDGSMEHLTSDPFSHPTTSTLESSEEKEKQVPETERERERERERVK